MPMVPRIQRSVDVRPLPQARKSAAETPQSTGAGVEAARGEKWRSIAGTAERIGQISLQTARSLYEEERETADQTALLEANNTLAKWQTDAMYNPETGALTKQGKDALGVPESVRAEFEKVAGAIEAGLGSPTQKQAFARLRSQEWQKIDLDLRRHVFSEMKQYQAGELKATVENSVNSAILHATDPKLVAVDLQKAVTAIETTGPRLGLGPEAIADQVRAAQSTTHVGVIRTLLAKDQDQAAQSYYEASAGQIDGQVKDDVIKALDEGTLRGEAARTTAEIQKGGGTFAEQLEKAKGIPNTKLADEVQRRLEHGKAVDDQIKAEREKADMRAGYDILDKTPDVSKIPPTLWSSYDGGTRSAMLSYAATRVKGQPVQTDWASYHTLMKIAGDDPEAFIALNLLTYRHKLDEPEFKELEHLWLSMKNSDRTQTDKTLTPFLTRHQLLDNSLELYGINVNAKPNTPEAKSVASLRRILDQQIGMMEAPDGKTGKERKVTNEEIQGLIDNLLMQQMQTPAGYFSGAGTKPLRDATIADVPANFKRRHPELRTDEAIVQAWIEAINTVRGVTRRR